MPINKIPTPNTIRLVDKRKVRVARAGQRARTTSRSFILEAIAEKIDEQDLREDFNATADRRYAEIMASGKTISWSEMRCHVIKLLDKATRFRSAR